MEQSVLLFSSEKESNPRYNVEKLWIPEISVQNREGTPYRNTEGLAHAGGLSILLLGN